MNKYLKIVTISDTHRFHKEVDLPEGDLLIHAGDFTSMGSVEDVEDFLIWLKKKSRKYTFGSVFIAGNHDKSFDVKYAKTFDLTAEEGKKPKWLEEMLLEYVDPKIGVRYLENTHTIVNDFKIWGSPVTPWFFGDYWAFNKNRGDEIKEVWETIPKDADIVVTHGPANGLLDYVLDSKINAGCEELSKYIAAIKPKLHVSGHIHEGYGVTKSGSTIYMNASYVNTSYVPSNAPQVITISK